MFTGLVAGQRACVVADRAAATAGARLEIDAPIVGRSSRPATRSPSTAPA